MDESEHAPWFGTADFLVGTAAAVLERGVFIDESSSVRSTLYSVRCAESTSEVGIP